MDLSPPFQQGVVVSTHYLYSSHYIAVFDIPANLANLYSLSVEAKKNKDFTIGGHDMNVGRAMVVGIYNYTESIYPTARHLPESISTSPSQGTTVAWVFASPLGFCQAFIIL